MARAVCSLHSTSRWAVTGTPIQNRLNDLAALLKFIRAHPYTDPKQFETDVSRFWKSGQDEEAVKRLKYLSACLLLRRAKGTINLPPRQDMKCPVDFTLGEREVYENIREQAITKIDDALHTGSEASRIGKYVNILQQIESLRLVCNLGLHYHTRHEKKIQPSTDAKDWAVIAQQTFNQQREMAQIICLQCSSTWDVTETLLDDPTATTQHSPLFSRCLRFACGECTQKEKKAGRSIVCGHNPTCPIAPVLVTGEALEDVPDVIFPQAQKSFINLPSKVKALVADLKSLPADVKWYGPRP